MMLVCANNHICFFLNIVSPFDSTEVLHFTEVHGISDLFKKVLKTFEYHLSVLLIK